MIGHTHAASARTNLGHREDFAMQIDLRKFAPEEGYYFGKREAGRVTHQTQNNTVYDVRSPGSRSTLYDHQVAKDAKATNKIGTTKWP